VGGAQPGQAERHSAITPWPANEAVRPRSGAASPWCGLRASRRADTCLARALPSTTGLTISRCDGLAVSDQVDLVAVELAVRRGAEVIFHVARAFDLVGTCRSALNSWKIARWGLAITCASTLGRRDAPCRSAMSFTPSARRADDLLERRDHRLAPSRPKRLVPVN